MPAAPARVTLATKSNPEGFYSEKGAAFVELRGTFIIFGKTASKLALFTRRQFAIWI